jgi:hypothetical protein
MYNKLLHNIYWIIKYNLVLICFMCFAFSTLYCASQTDSNLVLTFDFNDHTFNEKKGLLKAKPLGVNLVEDRFGNDASAVFLSGHIQSYLSLGTSDLLKPTKTTISIWVNLSRRNFAGKGYDSNPIFIVKNGPQDDFYVAYAIGYDCYSKRFGAGSTLDSTKEVSIFGINETKFGIWYHFVMTSDDKNLAFYINGILQGRSEKNFRTKFLTSDSVIIGHSANKKNERFSIGVFDDIQIFHRVLSEPEIKELYNAPNPNRLASIGYEVLKWLLILVGIIVVASLIVWRRQIALKRASEKLNLEIKLHEMEIRTLRSQMNPHFIFNSLNSIQQFIVSGDNVKAEMYLSKFSKLIRDLLESNANEGLLLVEEVEILKGYLEMEMLRFDNSFSYAIKVDDKLNAQKIKLPHLMIQPFVENAIWHGLLIKKGGGSIDVNFEYESLTTIKCIIDDNGIGREASKKRENTFKKKSLALSMVKQRLEFMAQSLKCNCNVEIIDKINEQGIATGTKVVVILPIENI